MRNKYPFLLCITAILIIKPPASMKQLMITAMKVRDANHIIQSSRQALNMKNVMNVSSIDQILYF